MDKDNFTISFHGDAVKNGEIEAQDLAIALISMSNLVQIANREANGEQAQISIKISETKKGSFEIILSLIQNILEHGPVLLEVISDTRDVLGLLMTFLKLLKRSKGKNIKKDEITAPPAVEKIFENKDARKDANQLVSILDSENINKIKIKRHDDDEVVEIDASEVSFFDLPDDDEDLLETTREVALQIENLSFKPKNKWRVNDGQSSFYVMIEDEDFLRRVENSRISFSNGDTLICIIREHQLAEDPTSKKECSIIKVLKHHSSAKQLGLL